MPQQGGAKIGDGIEPARRGGCSKAMAQSHGAIPLPQHEILFETDRPARGN
jgi:hypothetical protein